MKIISTAHKLLFFKTTNPAHLGHKDLEKHFKLIWKGKKIWTCRQLQYYQLRISEIGISLEIILNTFKCLTVSLSTETLILAIAPLVDFSQHPLLTCYGARCVHFNVPSGRRGAFFFLRGHMYRSGSTFIKKIEPFICHYISMPRYITYKKTRLQDKLLLPWSS